MEHLLVPTQAQTVIPGTRVLVIAPHPDDEVFGCGGAILRHVAQGTPVHVKVWTTGGFGVPPGAKAEYVAARQRESQAAAQVLGYGTPEFGTGEDRGLCYGEQLVQELLALIAAHEADLVYAPSVMEMHPDHRALGMAAVEAVRRRGADIRLAQYEIGIPLRPNLLLDITAVLPRKLEAVQCFASQLKQQRYDLDVAALNRYRSWSLAPEVTAAEAYLVATGAELQGDPLGLYQSEHVKQAALGLPLDSRDLPLVSVIIRSMDRTTLDLALDSIALQTWLNIEVVVVNATGRAHRPLGAQCGRFPLRLVEPGRGLERAAAANCGLDAARGDYLIFLDDDDLMLPHHIARLAGEFRVSESTVAVYASVIGTDAQGQEMTRFDRAFDPVRLRMGNYIPIHALLFRRAAVARGARFDESLPVCEDWDFWLQLLEQGSFRFVPEVGAIYHMQNDNNNSGVWVNMDESRRVVLRILKKWLERWSDREVWSLMEYARFRFLYDELDAKRKESDAEYSARITALESFIAEKDADTGLRLAQKEATIAERDAALAHQAAMLAHQEAMLAQRDAVIASKEGLIAEKDAVNVQKESVITALGERLQDQLYYIGRLKASLEDQIRAIHERDDYLAAVLGSTSWRITAPLRRLSSLIRGRPQISPPPARLQGVVGQDTATPSPVPDLPQAAPAAPVEAPPVAPVPAVPAGALAAAPAQSALASAPDAAEQPATAPESAPLPPASPSMPEAPGAPPAEPEPGSAAAFVRALVGGSKHVLELGCGSGALTCALQGDGSIVTGVDADPEVLARVRPYCEAVQQQDLDGDDWSAALGDARFDTVVAADVLARLRDPARVLQQMAGLLRPDGALVVALPHAGHAAVAASLLASDVAYGDHGLLDRRNLRFFGLKNVEAMFAAARLKIVAVRFVMRRPEQTELAAQWNALNEFARAALRLGRHANIYEVVVRAVAISQPGTPVSLLKPD